LDRDDGEADDELRCGTDVARLSHLLDAVVEDAREAVGLGEQGRQAEGETQADAEALYEARDAGWFKY
jgi:hypothetical protein